MVLYNCDCTSNLLKFNYLRLLKPCVRVLERIPSNNGNTGGWRGGWMKANCEAMAEKQLEGQWMDRENWQLAITRCQLHY
jgi:hypothetical protein